MPNKMSDPNSALMQMLMEMMNGAQPSSNIIKANSPTQQNVQTQSMYVQQQQMQRAQQAQMTQRAQPELTQSQLRSQFTKTSVGNMGNIAAKQEQKQPPKQPTMEQVQKARELAQTFMQTKNIPFSLEKLQEIEAKILERLVQG
ncbi:MAG: hypothetical protein K6B43_14535 [Treponema sp.]|nr:hypothetical protein [Treponema sp.]